VCDSRRASGVRLQAVVARRLLEVAHVRVLAVVTVITSGTARRPLAPGWPVEMVTHIVSLEFRSSALGGRPAAGGRAAASPSGSTSSGRRFVAILSAAVVVLASHPLLERIPLVQHVRPPIPHLSVG
jgi:hypothetical protein